METLNALVYWGGWDGHTPRETAARFAQALDEQGFEVDIEDNTRALADPDRLARYDLIVPCWTMASPEDITPDMVNNLSAAVKNGAGLAGVHGGMGDSVHHSLTYQWMVGGQFVGHPHVGDYAVRVANHTHPAMRGLPAAFAYKSEQYYMLVDPDINVLAVTDYCWNDELVAMPVAWTKRWGKGRVFYSALGHVAQEFETYPFVLDMTVRGMVWAALGETADDDDESGPPSGCGCGHAH